MGYPTKRVSMTDVHGEPQQGGYLPAEIWHAYMAAVTEGQKCIEFPPATEPLSYQPFFGKFASTGMSSQTSENERRKPEKARTQARRKEQAQRSSGGPGGPGNSGGAPGETGGPPGGGWQRRNGHRGGGPAGGDTHARTEAPTPHTGGPRERTPGNGGGAGQRTGGAAPG